MASSIIFLSDFGYRNEWVGICHAVIDKIAPDANVIDLSHGVPPLDVQAGALVLSDSLPLTRPDRIGPGGRSPAGRRPPHLARPTRSRPLARGPRQRPPRPPRPRCRGGRGPRPDPPVCGAPPAGPPFPSRSGRARPRRCAP